MAGRGGIGQRQADVETDRRVRAQEGDRVVERLHESPAMLLDHRRDGRLEALERRVVTTQRRRRQARRAAQGHVRRDGLAPRGANGQTRLEAHHERQLRLRLVHAGARERVHLVAAEHEQPPTWQERRRGRQLLPPIRRDGESMAPDQPGHRSGAVECVTEIRDVVEPELLTRLHAEDGSRQGACDGLGVPCGAARNASAQLTVGCHRRRHGAPHLRQSEPPDHAATRHEAIRIRRCLEERLLLEHRRRGGAGDGIRQRSGPGDAAKRVHVGAQRLSHRP